MTAKHLFYITANRLGAFVLQRDTLVAGPAFEFAESGFAGFNDYLQSTRSGLVYVLADVVEEDFHVEMIPWLRGGNRRQVIARRTAQRYRDTSLSLALSLGIEKSERRDERLLLAAITNTGLLQPWLNVIRERGLPLVGVYSMAFATVALLRRIAPKLGTALLVSLEPGGLRQTFVQANKLRFSRLGPIDPADAAQPTRIAAAFAAETARIYQYLTAVRALPRDGGPLDAVLLAPPSRSAVVAAAVSDTQQIRYHVIDAVEAGSRVGLTRLPQGTGSEALFLYALARYTPPRQYAPEALRRGYRLWQARAALLAASAAVFAACAVGAMVERFSINELHSQIRLQQDLTRQLDTDYAKVTQSFPKIPTTSENLRGLVTQFVSLRRTTDGPEPLLARVSLVLDQSPRIALDQLKWDGAVVPASTKGAPAQTRSTKPDEKPSNTYDVLQMDGKILGVSNSDYKTINEVMNDFVARLRAAGLEIIEAKLPFDAGSQATLSGDALASQTAEAPAFTISVGTRAAP
jgi:hypothetical protein